MCFSKRSLPRNCLADIPGSGVELRSLLIYISDLPFGRMVSQIWRTGFWANTLNSAKVGSLSDVGGGFTQLAFAILPTLFCSDAFLLSIRWLSFAALIWLLDQTLSAPQKCGLLSVAELHTQMIADLLISSTGLASLC